MRSGGRILVLVPAARQRSILIDLGNGRMGVQAWHRP